MLTQHQKELFEARGLLRLGQFLPKDKVRATQEVVYRLAAEEGAWQDGVWQLEQMEERPPFTKRTEEFSALMTQELLDVISMLVDGQPVRATNIPSFLFSLPQKTPWRLPVSWHTDIPRQPLPGPPAVQIFTFLETVHPKGGGTLVVSGSHRLGNNGKYIRSKEFRESLKVHPYFEELMSKEAPDRERYLTIPGRVDDVDLQVEELHGEPGDVYLMDMRVLHTRSDNNCDAPRLMITHRYLLESTIERSFAGLKSPRRK